MLLYLLITGELDENERDRVLERMKEDVPLRNLYGSMVEMEAMLHHEFPRMAEFREPAPMVRRPKRQPYEILFRGGEGKRGIRLGSAVAAVAALVALFLVMWMAFKPERGPILVDVYGESYWLDGAGRKLQPKIGEPVPAGSVLVTEGAGAHAKLRFPDASEAMLSGDGELRLGKGKAKRLLLGSGNLEVEMSKQPEGRPALVETPTARIEVVGTRFSIDATRASTTVAVSEGAVKLNRLADGSAVEIPHGKMATASLDATAALDVLSFSDTAPAWQMTMSAGDDMAVEPFRAGTQRDGKPIIHHGAWFRNEKSGPFGGLATLDATSRVRVKFRTSSGDAYLRVFLVCRDSMERSAGNRQTQIRVSSLAEDGDGWRVFEGNIRDMEVLASAGDFNVAGARVIALCVSTLESSDRLELAEVSVSG